MITNMKPEQDPPACTKTKLYAQGIRHIKYLSWQTILV